jgi:peptide chain release factor subunit 1
MFSNNKKYNECLVVVPPKPLRKYIYRCDRRFHLDYLDSLYQDHYAMGMMLVRGDCTEFYRVNGDEYELVKRLRARIPGRTRRGGQSQNRIQRLRNEAEGRYVGSVAEEAIACFWDEDDKDCNILGLVLMGPGNKKNLVHQALDQRIKKLVRNVVTIEGSERIQDLMTHMDDVEEEESPWVDRFFEDLELSKGKAVYGPAEIKRCLNEALLEVLLVKKGQGKKWKERCKNVGCTIVESSNNRLSNYGDVVGMAWFVLAE